MEGLDHPTITIGGHVFSIPPLSIGQLKHVVPAAQRLNGMNPSAFTAQNIEDMQDIVYYGILRTEPTFERGKYLAMGASIDDLLIAYPIVAGQAGMKFVDKQGSLDAGEQKAVP